MIVEIHYCEMCGGHGEASRVADEIKSRMQLKAVLVDVSKGRFDVVVDGQTVFSKHDKGRFPRTGEVVTLIKKAFK